MNYNQYTDKYTKNACSLVTLLNIMKYRYAIQVEPSFIMKVAIFFDKLGLRSPDSWAVFNIIYKWFVYYMNKKLWLNFKVVTKQISTLDASDDRTYWLGIKWYSTYKWNKISEKGYVTKEDMDYLAWFKGWIWHNTAYDWTPPGFHVDTNWTKPYKFPLDVLKYWQTKDLFWNNIRTIEPDDHFTKRVAHFTIRLFEAERKSRLDSYIQANKNNKYVKKALELYNFWK